MFSSNISVKWKFLFSLTKLKCVTFDGLGHLEGETVAVFADGLIQLNKTVASNQITLDVAVDKAHAGLPYTSVLETLPIEGGNPIGSAMGKIKRISKVVLRLYKSLRFTIGDLFGNESETVTLDTSLYTGDSEELNVYGGYETGGQIKISIDDPRNPIWTRSNFVLSKRAPETVSVKFTPIWAEAPPTAAHSHL